MFTFNQPTREEVRSASLYGAFIHTHTGDGEIRALVRLDAAFDAFLYVTRTVDAAVLSSLQRTGESVALYERLESRRDLWMAQFAALYLGFAVLVLAAAIYLGLWFAERLARPIGNLASAAARVRDGDLFARVQEERGDDEIALLSRVFNRMTEEVKRKQDALHHCERRVRTAAVVLRSSGRRRDAGRHRAGLGGTHSSLQPHGGAVAAALRRRRYRSLLHRRGPEFADLLNSATYDPSQGVESPIRIQRGSEDHDLLARITSQRESADPLGAATGYVVTIDDLTDLLAAQRMAAWGDVARRIAHEIKNPLTPIQLAAERLRRKYGETLGEDEGGGFSRYTETIVRQTEEIRRMVDAFVRFAKMPSPKMVKEDMAALLREAVLLQEKRVRISPTASSSKASPPRSRCWCAPTVAN